MRRVAVVCAHALERRACGIKERKHALAHFGELIDRHGSGADVGCDLVAVRGVRRLARLLRGIVEAVHHRVDRGIFVAKHFAQAQDFLNRARILNNRGNETDRELLDRLRNFDFARTGEELMRTHAAQIRAQRILRETGRFFGREHHGGIIFVDIVARVAAHAVDENVVLIGRGLEHLNAEAAQLLGHFLEVFRRAQRALGEIVVDVDERHPAARAAEAHQFAVAVLGLSAGLAGSVAVRRIFGHLAFLPGVDFNGILVRIVNDNIVGFREIIRIDRFSVIGIIAFIRLFFLSCSGLLRGLRLLRLICLIFFSLLRLGRLFSVIRRFSLSLLLALRRLFLLGVSSLFGIRLLRSPSLGGLQSLRFLSLLSRIRSLGRRLDHGFIRVVRSRLLCRLAHSALPRHDYSHLARTAALRAKSCQ